MSIYNNRWENLNRLPVMVSWATESCTFNDACNRAEILGNFILHHNKRDEAKEALKDYVEAICQHESAARYVRRDIIFCLESYFLEPDYDTLCDEVLNAYDDAGEALSDLVVCYKMADEEERKEIRDKLPQEVNTLIDEFYENFAYYHKNQTYIDELHGIVDAIMGDKYGIKAR